MDFLRFFFHSETKPTRPITEEWVFDSVNKMNWDANSEHYAMIKADKNSSDNVLELRRYTEKLKHNRSEVRFGYWDQVADKPVQVQQIDDNTFKKGPDLYTRVEENQHQHRVT